MIDPGNLGTEKDFSKQLSAFPCKKKRDCELSTEEEKKEYNKIHSKKKIVMAPAIYRLKKYRIRATYSEIDQESMIEFRI